MLSLAPKSTNSVTSAEQFILIKPTHATAKAVCANLSELVSKQGDRFDAQNQQSLTGALDRAIDHRQTLGWRRVRRNLSRSGKPNYVGCFTVIRFTLTNVSVLLS